MDEFPDLELTLNRFNRLVKEILAGQVRRTCFQPWEIELLIDLQECALTRSRRAEALQRYQRAVQKQLERRQFPPIRFSAFLNRRAQKQNLAVADSLAKNDPASVNA